LIMPRSIAHICGFFLGFFIGNYQTYRSRQIGLTH
jgi:hypothetical protein